MSHRHSGSGQGALLAGCLAALIVSLLSCALFTGLAVSPAFTTSVPPPPVSNPADRDLTIVVKEAYLQRTLIETLPAAVSEGASLEVRDDNRLVISTAFDLLIHSLEIVITIYMSAQDGELNVRIDTIEAQARQRWGTISSISWAWIGRPWAEGSTKPFRDRWKRAWARTPGSSM